MGKSSNQRNGPLKKRTTKEWWPGLMIIIVKLAAKFIEKHFL
jgi:hypothetical protein